MRRVWASCLSVVVCVVCAACATPPKPEAGGDGPATRRIVTPITRLEQRVVVNQGRKAGYMTLTTSKPGEIAFVYHVLENGRGPHAEGRLTLGPDGTPTSFAATGHHTMSNKLDESFELVGGRAHWHSLEEEGERAVTGTAFFLPNSELPIEFALVPAALRAGGTLTMLPGGQARVTKVATLDVTAEGTTRSLVAYEISGLYLDAYYTWFDREGNWFGNVSEWSSVIPKGWEAAIDPIVAKQHELERAHQAAIAQQNATKPIAGIAFTNARLLDVEKGAWVPNQTVVIVGDTIKAVGPTGKVKVPEGIDEIALDGKALLPGLIDMHSHTDATGGLLDIASGVTTARDVGNDPDLLDDLKARFDSGAAVGPSMVRMGFIEGRNEKAASSKITAETPEEAKAAVEFYAKRGYDGIKIYNSVKPELVPLLAADAHARKMLVTGHIPVHMLAHEAVDAGYDGIEHINMLFLNFLATHDTDTRDTTRFTLPGDHATEIQLDSAPVREFIAQLKKHETVIDPTLNAFEDMYMHEPGKITPGVEDLAARLPLNIRRSMLIAGLEIAPEKRGQYRASWARMLAMVKVLHDAKVPVVAGTDSIPGLFLHHELELLVSTGIPAADVLRMATLDAARAMRLEKRIGSIAAGKRADLVVVDGDPIADIKQIRKTVYTMRAGVLYKTDALYKAAGVSP